MILNTQFQENFNNSNCLKSEIDKLNSKLNEKSKIYDEKISSLKSDLKITLENNDINNLEIRKLKLYNFLFKFSSSASIVLNIYLINKKL